jgi:hypothetical protein
MNRCGYVVLSNAAALVAAAGLVSSAHASINIGPTDVITWGGTSVGRATPGTSTWASTSSTGVAASGTSTLAWTSTVADDPQIDSGGRVYFRARVAPTPAIGALTAPRAIFSATNSTDNAAYMIDGNVVPSGTGYRIGSGDLATSGIKSTNTLHVSGTQVGVGIQIGDPSNPVGGTGGTIGGGTLNLNETFSSNSSHNIDNSLWFSGPSSGVASAMSPTLQRNEAVTGLPVSEYNVVGTTGTGTARISSDFSGFANSSTIFDMNSTGTTAFVGTFYSGTTATTQNPIISNAPNGGGAPTAAGARFVATKTAGGSLSILQHNGTVLTGTQAHPYNTGTAVGETIGLTVTTFGRINRSGQVAFNSDLSTAISGTTTANNDITFINTPGSGNMMVYREGEKFDSSNSIGTLSSGAALVSTRSFSNAGLLYSSALVNPATLGTPGGVLGDGQPGNGDVTTTAGVANNSALYISTTTGATRVLRQNDQAPGLASNVRVGSLSATAAAASQAINNSGSITVATGLQGAGTVAPVSGSQLGNNAAIFSGPAGSLAAVARLGDAAPGFDGGAVYGLSASTVPLLNNNGTVLFTSPVMTGINSDGTYSGTLASHTTIASALFGWMPGATSSFLVLYSGQSVEVDTGVFKTISSFSVAALGNGDGGVEGLNDSDVFTARLTFTDATWSVVKLQVPAPGTGGLAILGLGVLARRRRR